MGLHGTIDTFTVAEILGLVERARKTGTLDVLGPAGRGTLWLQDGAVVAAEMLGADGPVAPEAAHARALDVCVALVRLDAGSFELALDRPPAWSGPPISLAELVPDAQALAAACAQGGPLPAPGDVLVIDDSSDGALTVSRAALRLLAHVDGQRTVAEIAGHIGRATVEVALALRELAEDGVIAPATGRIDQVDALDALVAQVEAEPAPHEPAPEPPPLAVDPASVVEPSRALEDEDLRLPPGALHAVREAGEPGADGPMVTSVPDPSATFDREELARERAALAALAGLDDPGPVPEREAEEEGPHAPVEADATWVASEEHPGPAPEHDEADAEPRTTITADRGALLRLFSGLRSDHT